MSAAHLHSHRLFFPVDSTSLGSTYCVPRWRCRLVVPLPHGMNMRRHAHPPHYRAKKTEMRSRPARALLFGAVEAATPARAMSERRRRRRNAVGYSHPGFFPRRIPDSPARQASHWDSNWQASFPYEGRRKT